MGLEKISQDQQIRLEDFRRIVTEAYVAGYNAGFADSKNFMLETPPSLNEQELYYSHRQLLS